MSRKEFNSLVMVETLMLEPHTTESQDKGGRREQRDRGNSKGKKETRRLVPTDLGRAFRNFLRANKILRNKDGSGGMDGADGVVYEGRDPAKTDPDTIVRWLLPFMQQSAPMARITMSTLLRHHPIFWIHFVIWCVDHRRQRTMCRVFADTIATTRSHPSTYTNT